MKEADPNDEYQFISPTLEHDLFWIKKSSQSKKLILFRQMILEIYFLMNIEISKKSMRRKLLYIITIYLSIKYNLFEVFIPQPGNLK
jgi:hypothetical protein